jgi:nickel-dependent lactate racemase
MATYYAKGSPATEITDAQLEEILGATLARLDTEPRGVRQRVLALPPDFTRFNSRAGQITCLLHRLLGARLVDVMPALGTHFKMPDWQLARMFPTVPPSLFREHRWREDVLTIGHVPQPIVREATAGIYDRPWPAQLNKLVWQGQHDLILSIGQVVPHEVIGMANYNKNLFVGTGGEAGINESHFIGAVYGMERMMGRADTPLRRILNYAEDHFCQHLPIVYILTVIGAASDGRLVIRGLFIGDDVDCFLRAAELSLQVNFTRVERPLPKVVVYLDPEEFHSTWLGNKSIYRTRMAIADGGELLVLAPAVKTFGEDPQIDKLIRKYGYRTSAEVLRCVAENEDLRANLSAAAHLIHGSSENRFRITYCPGELSRDEICGAGYDYASLAQMLQRYSPDNMREGWNTMPDGEEVYYVGNPALGLWAHSSRLTDA